MNHPIRHSSAGPGLGLGKGLPPPPPPPPPLPGPPCSTAQYTGACTEQQPKASWPGLHRTPARTHARVCAKAYARANPACTASQAARLRVCRPRREQQGPFYITCTYIEWNTHSRHWLVPSGLGARPQCNFVPNPQPWPPSPLPHSPPLHTIPTPVACPPPSAIPCRPRPAPHQPPTPPTTNRQLPTTSSAA